MFEFQLQMYFHKILKSEPDNFKMEVIISKITPLL